MEFERPDNINNTLSQNLTQIKFKNGVNDNLSSSNYWYYLLSFLFLIIMSVLIYFYFYKRTGVPYIPIHIDTNLATSTRVYPNITPTSTPTSTRPVSTSTQVRIIPGIEKMFYIIWPDAITGYSDISDYYKTTTSTEYINTISFKKNIPAKKQAIEKLFTILSTTTSKHIITFQDKITGHIYRAEDPDFKPYKVANTSINNILFSKFANNGNTIIFQTLNQNTNTLSTYMADISPYKDLPNNLINKAFLGDNIKSFDISPDGKSLIYIIEDNKKLVSNIYIMNTVTRNIQDLNTFPIINMHISYSNANTATLYQMPLNEKPGQAYNINIDNNTIRPLIKGVGLIYKNNDVLELYNDSGNTFINYKSINTKFSFSPLVEKCSISLSNTFILCAADDSQNTLDIDKYYDNSLTYNDKLWLHGLDYPEERIIYDFNYYNKIQLHIYSMILSRDNENLYMMDKLKGFYMLKIYNVLNAEKI